MTKFTTAAVAAALLAIAPAVAIAQPTPLVNGSDVETTRDSDSTIDQSQAPRQLAPTGIESGDFTSALDALQSPNGISLVAVGNNPQFSAGANTESLRNSVMQSKEAMQALQASGLTPDNVVGIEAAGDGAVTLYVNG